MQADPFHLVRFVEAQASVIDQVMDELRSGRKRSHWMWFVFPQMKGLGASAMSEHYGLSGLDEARAYLDHQVLGPRLLDCTRLALAAEPRTAEAVFGYPDHLKFCSSMTLFAAAAPREPLFRRALDLLCGGTSDPSTLRLVAID